MLETVFEHGACCVGKGSCVNRIGIQAERIHIGITKQGEHLNLSYFAGTIHGKFDACNACTLRILRLKADPIIKVIDGRRISRL